MIKTNVQAVHDTLQSEFRRDDRLILLGEDVGVRGGVFRVSDGFIEEFGADRIIDTPVAESSIVGVAIGAALGGLVPIAEMQFADFSAPAFEQIVDEAARMRYRSNGAWGVPMVIRMPWGGAIHGALYHSQSVEAFYAHVPGLKVVVPSTPYDITVFAYGLMLHHSLAAAEALAADGVSVNVVDLRSLRPLDVATILREARKTGKCLVVYEDNRMFGAGAEIAALIAEEAFSDLDAPVMRIGGPEVPAMPYNKPQEDWFMPDPAKIAAKMRELAAY